MMSKMPLPMPLAASNAAGNAHHLAKAEASAASAGNKKVEGLVGKII
jgi:hypothetical protein